MSNDSSGGKRGSLLLAKMAIDGNLIGGNLSSISQAFLE